MRELVFILKWKPALKIEIPEWSFQNQNYKQKLLLKSFHQNKNTTLEKYWPTKTELHQIKTKCLYSTKLVSEWKWLDEKRGKWPSSKHNGGKITLLGRWM